MHYVYVLQSVKNKSLYVGRSSNLKQRLTQHKNNNVHTTARFGGIELIFYEAFRNITDSIRRERYLKTSKGKSSLRQMARRSLL